MVTYLEYKMIQGYAGYNVFMDRDEDKRITMGWISAGQLELYLSSYLDIPHNRVYIQMIGSQHYIEIPPNWANHA